MFNYLTKVEYPNETCTNYGYTCQTGIMKYNKGTATIQCVSPILRRTK